MTDSPIDWARFVDLIRSANRIVLTSHQRPDGDSLGSVLAMSRILGRLGKDVRVANPHRVPPTLACLDPEGRVLKALDQLTDDDRAWIDGADLFMVLDTSSWAQMADVALLFKAFRGKKAVLDHHIKGDEIDAERFVDEHAEATGSLVARAARELGVPLDRDIADPLFVAISTDTGWFRFDSVTAETYRTVAELIDAGSKPAVLYRELNEQESLGRIRLMGRTLAKTEPHFGGLLMFTSIMQEDLRESGALPSDTEDIINMTLQVKGSRMAVLMSEQADGTFKISFRSRCDVDCSRLAKQFSGGGHHAAAGASSELPYDETRRALVDAIGKALEDCGMIK